MLAAADRPPPPPPSSLQYVGNNLYNPKYDFTLALSTNDAAAGDAAVWNDIGSQYLPAIYDALAAYGVEGPIHLA